MNCGEGWNSLEDYSLFLPDDAFDLFGEYGLDLDFNSFLDPTLDEANNAFFPVRWDVQDRSDPARPEVHLPSSTLEQTDGRIPSPNATTFASNHTAVSSPSCVRSLDSEDQASTHGSAASGTEDKHQVKDTAAKRKFFKAFSVSSGNEVPLHSRKRFSEERKKAVALNRIIGVCLHCRLRKVAVSSVGRSSHIR
jgi:hypothetical protein